MLNWPPRPRRTLLSPISLMDRPEPLVVPKPCVHCGAIDGVSVVLHTSYMDYLRCSICGEAWMRRP